MTGSAASMQRRESATTLTVGQVAERYDVTVRTLHHYDAVGLLHPTERSPAGYRHYTGSDVARLRQIMLYRRLGFALDQIALLLDHPGADLVDQLRRQRAALAARLEETTRLVAALDRALEAAMSGNKLTDDEQRELFGDGVYDDYSAEAEQRWGDTAAWREHQRRTSHYTKADWQAIMAESAAVSEGYAAAMRAGEAPTSDAAMAAAEAHRRHIEDRFYDISYSMHRGLADMFVADERFAKHFEEREPGLAGYVRDAIHANADRHQT